MKPFSITAFAPATLSNLGPGFDILGAALDGVGDTVTVRPTERKGVRLIGITGDEGRLPTDVSKNTASLAALGVLKYGRATFGVDLKLKKGLPLGSGLGSSAASAAAAAFAVNRMLKRPLELKQLVEICVETEAAVSGRHADNVAPAIFGGIVLVLSLDPLDVISLPIPKGLFVAVVKPDIEISTKAARKVLPKKIPIEAMVHNCAHVASMVAAFHSGDLLLLGRSVEDVVVEPVRAKLIPGFMRVKRAATDAGAIACSISGSGPAIFAFCAGRHRAKKAAQAMTSAFLSVGLKSTTLLSPISPIGARIVK